MAIRSTSSGRVTITSPFMLNMTTMVNSNPMMAVGPSLGMNLVSYHPPPHGWDKLNC